MAVKAAVIMCAHNSADFIKEAIESILSQDFADFEFIIVENGSTDNTWQIINSYKDGRIKAFQMPFKQLSFNLNFAILQTEADYIFRMDSDDIARPQRLKKQIEFLDANPDIAVLGGAFEIFGDNIERKVVPMPQTNQQIRRRQPFRFCICHPTVVFRRKIIIDAGGYQGARYCQDIDLWLRLGRDKNIKFSNLPDVLIDYRVHPKQAKGGRESFIINSVQLLREALYRRSPLFFTGFMLSLMKILFRKMKP